MEVIKWGFSPECEPLGCSSDALLPPHPGGDGGGGGGRCPSLCIDHCQVPGW